MWTQLDVTSEHPAVAPLTLVMGSITDTIQVRNVEGLGPVKANISSVEYGIVDGEAFTGSSVGKRNIVLTLGLNPDWEDQTVESLRQLLYEYFMPKLNVNLKFTSTHLPVCAIDGVVEDLTPNIFSKDPEVSVSILCPSPDLVAVAQTTKTGVVVTDNTLTVVDYEGTKPTGINLKIQSSVANVAYTGNLQIFHQWVDLKEFDLTAITIDATHYFELNSYSGAKYVRTVVTPALTPTNVLNKVTGNPEWPVLKPGANNFSVKSAEAGQAWVVTYFARFGGL